jgi:hypothetical protein
MTVQVQQYTVTLDGSNNPEPLTLSPPGGPGGSTAWRWVVIQNLTPYTALLQGTADDPVNIVSLAPGTQDRYAWSNIRQAIKVTSWISPLAGGDAPPGIPKMAVMFSDDPTGDDFAGSFPGTIQSGVNIGTITGEVVLTGPVEISSVESLVTVGGAFDDLGSGSGFTPASGSVELGPFTALHAYQSLMVTLADPTNATAGTVTAQAERFEGATQAFPTQTQELPAFPANPLTFIIPIACAPGDQIGVILFGSMWGSSAVSAPWEVDGLTADLTTQVITPRATPLGTYTVGGQSRSTIANLGTGAVGQIIPANTLPPGYSFAFKDFGCVINADTKGGWAEMYITNTGDDRIAAVQCPSINGLAAGYQGLDGLLETTEVAINVYNNLGATHSFWTKYDIIPTPALQ